jgi:hypothetical protein
MIFICEGNLNVHNSHLWAHDNREGPCLLPDRVTGQQYRDFLETGVLEDAPLAVT